MRQIQPDLWETVTEHPAPGLYTHAYLLTRDAGNVLFYGTGNLAELDEMARLGGVARQYLSHQDEVGESLRVVHERFGAQLAAHAAERDIVARVRAPDILFDKRETHAGGIEVIPAPGHSPGSTCFLVTGSTGLRYLFTGDTLYRGEHGEWHAGFIPGYTPPADKPVLAASLALLGELEPDVAISSAFAGESGFEVLEPGAWRARVEHAIDELMRGERPA